MYSLSAQTLVNESWSSTFGAPSEIGWSASALGENGKIYTTGHSVSDNRPQLLLACHDSEGNSLWSSGLDATGISISFGAVLTLDEQGNIYVAGAAAGASTNAHDFLVAKFDTSGNQSWYTIFDGPGQLDDFVTAILITDTHGLFIAGLSSSSAAGQNIMAAKVGASGNVIWSKYYDYAQKDDAPTGIEVFDSTTVEILGGSQDGAGDWDVLSWRLPVSGIGAGTAMREGFPKLDYEKGLYYEKNNSGYYYFCGTKTSDSSGLNILLMKLKPGFQSEWNKEIDGGYGDDAAFSLALASDGTLAYLGGYSTNRWGNQDLYVATYSSGGVLSKEHRRKNKQQGAFAAARAILVAEDGDTYAVGEAHAGEEKELVIIRFDKETGQLWEVNAGEVANPERQAFSLLLDEGGRLIFSGAIQEVESQKYVLKALEELSRERQVIYSEDTIPLYIKGEAIIRFAPIVLDSSFIDNKKLHYGPLCEVVTDTALLNEMEQLIEPGLGGEMCDCQLIKVFPGLTTEEVCITTLDGDPLYIPPFWTTMLLYNCTTGKNEQSISAALDSISAGRILYAHPNYVGRGDAECEDPLCDEQHSLWDTDNPDYSIEASINIKPAWEISTGDPEVKAGVFDSGIFYEHEDFGYGSVVEGSWDFVNGSSQNIITISEDLVSHGTRGAGIIGAIRGNDIGIAGIAGGDTGSPGITLLGLRVLNAQNMLTTSDYCDALVYSLQANGSPMFGIANNSFGVEDDGSITNDPGLMEEAVNLAFQAGVALVTSRGNGFEGGDLTQAQYPCSFDDELTICVGATGTDGNLKDDENGDPAYPGPGDDSYFSMYGDPMDLLAPGSGGLIKTTTNVDQGYGGHNGTSAAAPHATGVAALLASTDGDVRLSVEGLERIMEYSADDLGPDFYDQETGWGRLNAGNALEFIGENRILHFSAEPDPETFCDHSVTDCFLTMQGSYLASEAGYALNTGDVISYSDVIQYTWEIGLDICELANDPNAEIIHSEEKPGYWVRNSASNLWGAPEEIDPVNFGVRPYELVYFTEAPEVDGCRFQGELTGYSYKIYDDDTGQTLEGTMPAGLAACETPRLAISLLVRSENPVATDEEENAPRRLFPNPTTGRITLDGLPAGQLDVHLFSMSGQSLGQLFRGRHDGKSRLSLQLPEIPSGLYLCRIRSGQDISTFKIIKH